VHLLKPANQRRLAALYQRALAALFRGKFLSGLSQILDEEGLHLPDSDIADMRPLIQICSTPSAGFFMQNVPLAGRTKATWLGNTHRAALRTDGLSPSMRSGGPSPHQSRLPARFTAQGVNPLGPGVHPALQLAYSAFGTDAHPAL